MRKKMKLLAIPLLLLSLLVGVPARADFTKGLDAYERGDWAQALREWELIARNGDKEAQYYLGLMYRFGRGVTQDYGTALDWLLKSAKQDYGPAQNDVGLLFRSGRGVDRNLEIAVNWFRNAAGRGIGAGSYNLGLAYLRGQGVAQDLAEGVKWIKNGAEHRHALAQLELGRLYETGQGVEQDLLYAYMWLEIASFKGNEDAMSERDNLAQRLSSSDVAKAGKLANACVKKRLINC